MRQSTGGDEADDFIKPCRLANSFSCSTCSLNDLFHNTAQCPVINWGGYDHAVSSKNCIIYSPKIDIRINLIDPNLVLKYFIPINVKSNEVVCDVPYGNISRPRVPSTKMEAAKWEFGIQKWLDIGDGDYGVAVFNDSKYGVSANMKGIFLTLVR